MGYHYNVSLPIEDVCQIRQDAGNDYRYARDILRVLDNEKVTSDTVCETTRFSIPEHLAWELHDTIDTCLNSDALQDLSDEGIEALVDFWESVV